MSALDSPTMNLVLIVLGLDPFLQVASAEAAVAGDRERATWSYSPRQIRKEAAEVISGVGPQPCHRQRSCPFFPEV